MKWNPDIINTRIAPNISNFNSANIPELTNKFSQAKHWLTNHFLNSVLRDGFKPPNKQVVISYLRRAQNSFLEYHIARSATYEYLEKNDPLNPNLMKYYEAITHWEYFILQYAMAIDLFNWLNLGEKAFAKNDGSKDQRLYDMANAIKHLPSDITSGQCKEEHSIPLWIENNGLKSFQYAITFVEVSEALRELSTIADELHDPKTFKENTKN